MPTKVTILCPTCQGRLTVSSLGKKVKCAFCPKEFKAEEAAPPADPVVSDTAWVSGQQILPGYVVDTLLGQGGFGEVYRVKRLATDQLFAVKKARCNDEKHRSNFLAELQTWIDLPGHPNLVGCRFFRTVGEIAFANRRLTYTNPML